MEGLVSAFLDYLESQLTYSSSTRLAYQNDLRCFLAFLEKQIEREPGPNDFTPGQAAAFLSAEREAGRRPSTLLRRRASLRRFAAFLSECDVEWGAHFKAGAGLIDQAIAEPSPVQRPRYLNEAQVASLWQSLEESPRPRTRRDQAILALLLECGLTVGTLIALDVSDVETAKATLCLSSNPGARVWVPLGTAAEPMERYLLEGRPELNYQPDEPALFISQTGGRMSRQGVWQVLRQWGHKASLPVTLSPRMARHTAAYRLAHSGRPLSEVQLLLGHTNPLSTQALLRRLDDAVNEDEQLVPGSSPGLEPGKST